MPTVRWHRVGGVLLVGLALTGVAEVAYLLATGWDPATPGWARAVSLAFPPAAAAGFLWYLRRYRAHEDGDLYLQYAGTGSLLGGVAFLSPGVGLVIQQALVGRPVLNWEVYLFETWLGGGLVGLATGHFYAGVQGERARLDARRAELEESRQRLTVLNRVLRHDVRNRLTVISTSAARLAGDANGDGDRPLETIERTVGKIVALSEDARRIEAITRGEETPTEPADLATLAEVAVERARAEFPEVELRTDLPEETVVTTNGLLESAVRNVVENAAEHNDADRPEVTVEVAERPAAGEAVLRVADNGPGFPDHERVVLEGDRETGLQHSSGLGLWLVRWIVDDLGGGLDVADRQPRGTVVTIRLPLGSPEATRPAA